MKSRPPCLMATGLLVLGVLPAAAGTVDIRNWHAYGNPRFNFAACFPADFKGQGEATNGDGERFRTHDGAELAVYGSNVEPGTKLDDLLVENIADVAGTGARTTYHVQKRNWLVASGTGPKGEFYFKRFLRGDQMLSFEFVYPIASRTRYVRLVAPMIGCFTIGSEPGE